MPKRRYFGGRGKKTVSSVMLLSSLIWVRGSQRQQICLVTSYWQAYKYSAGTENTWTISLFSWAPLFFGVQYISLAGKYPWIYCSVILELRQGLIPTFRFPLVDCSTATKLSSKEMSLISETDPKLHVLLLRWRQQLCMQKMLGRLKVQRTLLSFPSNLGQSTNFSLPWKVKLALLIHNYNVLGFQYLNKLESNYFFLFAQYRQQNNYNSLDCCLYFGILAQSSPFFCFLLQKLGHHFCTHIFGWGYT